MISLSGTYADDAALSPKAIAMKISGKINWGILSFLILLAINAEQF